MSLKGEAEAGPALPGPLPPQRSMVSNAWFSLLTQIATATLTAALVLILVRVLEPSGYGLFALATSVGALAFLPADFGIVKATTRVIAERRDDAAAVRAVFLDAVRLKLLVGAPLCALLAVLAGPIADAYGAPGLVWPLRVVALAVLGQTMVALLSEVLTTLGRSEVKLRVVAGESAIEVGTSIAIVLAGGGAVGAAAGRATGYVAGSVLGLALVLRVLGWPRLARPRGAALAYGRQIGGYASALLLVDGAFVLFAQVDVLLIGGFLGTVAVASFQAPIRLLVLLHYPGLAAAAAVAPRYARVGGGYPDPAQLAATLRVVMLLQVAFAVATVAWARPLVDLLLGEGYGSAATVLAVLGPYTFLQGLGPLLSLTVNYAGEARRRLPIALAALAVDAVLGVLLIPRIGLAGGAISTDVGYTLYFLGHVWVCRRLLGLPLRPLASTLWRGLLAALPMAALLIGLASGGLTALEWVAGAVLGAPLYLGGLVVARAVSREELRLVVRWLRTRARRARA